MKIAAWVLLIVFALDVIVGPFMIGKKRKDYAATHWLVSLVFFVAFCLPVCGRVIGWW